MAEKIKTQIKKVAVFSIILAAMVSFASCTQPLYQDTFVISGTYLEVISPYRSAAGIVYQEFKRLDKIFNLHHSDSEIFRLNATYNLPFQASQEMLELLNLSFELEKLSSGAFDASYGALYAFWKDLIENGPQEFPDAAKIAELKRTGGSEHIKINAQENTILIDQPGLKIDFSAIAKGYLVDKAVLKLKAYGIKDALINAGGDIYCLGTNRGQPWNVGVRDPQELSEIVSSQVLIDEAVATSGNYEQFFEYQGRRYSHLIDPRSGYPVENDILSVSVVSQNCTTADGFATAFFVLGRDGVREFLSRNPSTMKIFVVASDGEGEHIYIYE